MFHRANLELPHGLLPDARSKVKTIDQQWRKINLGRFALWLSGSRLKKMKDLDSGPLYSHVMLETGTD